MSVSKRDKSTKSKLGQFMTPLPLAQRIVASMKLDASSVVLEPSFGDGSFLIPVIEAMLPENASEADFDHLMTERLYGCEIDAALYQAALTAIESKFGFKIKRHNLLNVDFFRVHYPQRLFNAIVGNPPFGGCFDAELELDLERQYGRRFDAKIKKETYSFFVVACVELLSAGGKLAMVCSDTLLTISTMKGLRDFLTKSGLVFVDELTREFAETTQPVITLKFKKIESQGNVVFNGAVLPKSTIELSANHSWGIDGRSAALFSGPTLSDFITATGGMTTGNNELFVKEIIGGMISETYEYSFFEEKITLARELERAKLGALSEKQRRTIAQLEQQGATRRNVKIDTRPRRLVRMPNKDYAYYNKSSSSLIYQAPTHAIFWKDDGDAVQTYKKNGNWYLHGVGGKNYFFREGISWQLVSQRLNVRYLPSGYVLDSGAPCAFLKPGIAKEELWFILGWLLTPKATHLMKAVLNHTRNIQSKDVERMPYPHWVDGDRKSEAIALVQSMVERAQKGEVFTRNSEDVRWLGWLYEKNEVKS